MRIVLVIVSLSGLGGGMERSAINLANAMAGRGHDVFIFTFSPASSSPLYPLDESITVHNLDLMRPAANKFMAVMGMLHSARVIRNNLNELRSDVVVAYGDQTCILTLAGAWGLNMPVVVAERTHPAYYVLGRGWGTLRRFLYPQAASLVAQTEDIASWYHSHIPGALVNVIPNHVLRSPVRAEHGDKPRRTVLGIGMLTGVKQFPLLIKAFAELADVHTTWDLIIYGEGPDRGMLEALVAEIGLSERIFFPGRVDDVVERMAAADLFVLTSRTEGFPNALCEAMACGLPAVSFDCPSGPKEVIREGVDGFLVPLGDVSSLARAMDSLMRDGALRREMGERAREISARFSLDQVNAAWEKLLRRVAG